MQSPLVWASKAEARQSIRAAQLHHSFTTFDHQTSRLLADQACRRGTSPLTIAVYTPLPDEPDIAPVYIEWYKKGHTLLFPNVTGQTMCWQRVWPHSLNEQLARHPMASGAFGTEWTGLIDVLVVPALAYSVEGHRLGRGKGYYDRLFATSPRPNLVVGVTRAPLIDSALFEPHDLQVDVAIHAAK